MRRRPSRDAGDRVFDGVRPLLRRGPERPLPLLNLGAHVCRNHRLTGDSCHVTAVIAKTLRASTRGPGRRRGRSGSRRACGLGDPAAGPDRREVADGGRAPPRCGGPRPPARRCRGRRATRPGERSLVGAATAASWSVHTSQVMSCSPSASSGRAAALVTAVGAEPLGRRAGGEVGGGGRVVEHHHPAAVAGEGERVAEPRRGGALHRHPRADVGVAGGAGRAGRSHAGRAPRRGRRRRRPTSTSAQPVAGALEEVEGQVVEQLVGEHHDRAVGHRRGQVGHATRTPSPCRSIRSACSSRWAADRSTST